MKRISLAGIYEWGLLAVLLLIVVHAPLTVALGSVWPEQATILKAWKEVLLAVLAVGAVGLLTRRKLWHPVLRSSPLVLLALTFIDIHLLLAVLRGGISEPVVAGLIIDLRFVVMFLLTYVLVLVRPAALMNVLKTIGAGAVVVLGFGLLQITVLPDDALSRLGYSTETITPYTTIDRNPDFVRINSTLRGPNPLGALAVVYGTLGLAYLLKRYATASAARRYIAIGGLAATVAVLFASFSRSAYLGLVAGVAAVAVGSYRLSKRLLLGTAAGVLVVAIALGAVSTTDWFSNVILHEDPESTVIAKSNDGHLASLGDGFGRLLTQPFGAGVGSTGSATLYDDDTSNDTIIENYYFFVAHESGWLGLATFLGLFVMVMMELWRRRAGWPALGTFGAGIGLGLIGLLLPVWADETVALIWWGLAGALIAPISGIMGRKHATGTRKQKTKGTA